MVLILSGLETPLSKTRVPAKWTLRMPGGGGAPQGFTRVQRITFDFCVSMELGGPASETGFETEIDLHTTMQHQHNG